LPTISFPPFRGAERLAATGDRVTPVSNNVRAFAAPRSYSLRVLHEEEARHQRSALRHFFDWIGYEPFVRKPCVLSGEIIDRDRQMAITIAVLVGLGAAVINGELNLEVGFRIAQVDQCEVVEDEAIGHVETERPSVEIDRAGLVENADHDVDRFRHRWRLPCCQESVGNPQITLRHLPLTAFVPETVR
jgi:hypothetical protein